MGLFHALKDGTLFKKSVRGAFESLQSLWHGEQGEESPKLRALLVLIGATAWADGEIDAKELETIRTILPEELSLRQGSAFLDNLKENHARDIHAAIEELADCTRNEKRELIVSMAKIAHANGNWHEQQLQLLRQTAEAFGFGTDELDMILLQEEESYQRNERILRSGAGVIVALVIIGIFILTATFLKAVLFGFVLAYLFLPLEKFFERKYRQPGPVFRMLCCCGCLFNPLYRFSDRIKKSFGGKEEDKTPEKLADEMLCRNVSKAVGTTVIFLILLGSIFFGIISTLSANYVAGISSELKSWADQQVDRERKRQQTEAIHAPMKEQSDYLGSLLAATIRKMEEFKGQIEKWPLVQHTVSEIAESLKNNDNQKALAEFILKKTGGMFSFTADFLSNFVGIIFDLLMTLFFFLLFLQKIALYTARRKNGEGISEYVVKSIFESNWMPGTGDETKAQARQIIEDIGMMLKTWLRGYLSIIAIESTIYILVFHLLGVPYALVLGFLAGCTVLLPYIGPVGSALLTLLVTLALGAHTSVLMLLAIVLCYIIITGIVDQFFIYPAFVGEALGLNRLETISVVLLGGVFAGLAGMIFAVPAASILKFLVPKIYGCWRQPPVVLDSGQS